MFDLMLIGLCLDLDSTLDDNDALENLILMLLVELEKTRSPDGALYPVKRHCMSFATVHPSESWNDFRFRVQDLPRLMAALQIDPELHVGEPGHQSVFSGEEGLLLLLRRLAYPCRARDLVEKFGLLECEISALTGYMIFHIHDTFHHILHDLSVWIDDLPSFRDAIIRKGSPPDLNIWAFVDGTLRPTCRPIYGQESQYSGHKRIHGLKFESVSLPNGIIARLFGPEDGRRHDITLARKSGLYDALKEIGDLGMEKWGLKFRAYADSGYIGLFNDHLIVGYKGATLTAEQLAFNLTMSKVRESVEWCFGKVITYFAFLDFRKNLKVFLQPVAAYYITGVLLTNCHTCFYGSLTSEYFGCIPPDIEDYLRVFAEEPSL